MYIYKIYYLTIWKCLHCISVTMSVQKLKTLVQRIFKLDTNFTLSYISQKVKEAITVFKTAIKLVCIHSFVFMFWKLQFYTLNMYFMYYVIFVITLLLFDCDEKNNMILCNLLNQLIMFFMGHISVRLYMDSY